MHLIAQTLDKQHQIRMTKVATLVGTHHLIGVGLQRQILRANDAAVSKCADRLGAARDRLGDFLPRRGCQTGSADKQSQQSNSGFFHVYQRGMVVVTSAFCARWRRK
ncbi:hypothetical protein D3C72_1421890 [compost metagenome]